MMCSVFMIGYFGCDQLGNIFKYIIIASKTFISIIISLNKKVVGIMTLLPKTVGNMSKIVQDFICGLNLRGPSLFI